jgi:toxin CptA
MHNAPSVSYPVGRSSIQGWLTFSLWLLGLATVLGWCWQVNAVGWRQYLALAAVLGAGAVAVQGWRQMPAGILRWDGQHWFWAATGEPMAIAVACRLDLQWHLLLQLRAESGRSLWCWVAYAQHPERWHGLRRAVYSPARPKADASAVFGSEP